MAGKRKINDELKTVPAVLEDMSVNADATPDKPKTPRKREDPIARAKRLLEEAEAKAKETAEKQLANAQKEMDLATNSLIKAQRIYNERSERLNRLYEMAGSEDRVLEDSVVLFGIERVDLESALQQIDDRNDDTVVDAVIDAVFAGSSDDK